MPFEAKLPYLRPNLSRVSRCARATYKGDAEVRIPGNQPLGSLNKVVHALQRNHSSNKHDIVTVPTLSRKEIVGHGVRDAEDRPAKLRKLSRDVVVHGNHEPTLPGH